MSRWYWYRFLLSIRVRSRSLGSMVDYKDRGKKIATMKGSFALAVKGDSVLVPRGGYHSNTY